MSQPGAAVPRVLNPMWLIALFLGVAEVTMGVVAAQVSGWVQGMFAIFAVLFPVGVAAAFFAILWTKPYVLYAPKDFPKHLDAASFVSAMRTTHAVKEEATEVAIAAAVETALGRILAARSGGMDTNLEIGEAVVAVRQEYERQLVLVDLSDFAESATELTLPIQESMLATEFLDSVWINLADEVDPFTYGLNWILRDRESRSVIYPEFAVSRVEQMALHASDYRTVFDVGIRPGAQIVAINLAVRKRAQLR